MAILITLIVVAVVVLLLVFWVIGMYNGLARARLRVREAWSGIDVQLKRRSSLIPNLVETVKGYAAHEKETLENVTRARAQLDNAKSPHEAAQADNILQGTLRSLFAVAEAYPDLKADQNFRELQRELTDTEDKIAYARQFYNTNVGNYNEKIATIPSSIIAGMFNFTPDEFYEAEETAREDVQGLILHALTGGFSISDFRFPAVDEAEFKRRTKRLALDVIAFTGGLPRTRSAEVIGRQLLRSGTSVGANYRAACRARSLADMVAKLGIVEEEADETIYWLELLAESRLVSPADTDQLTKETHQLLAMVVRSRKTLRSRLAEESTDPRKSKIENRKS